jgi:hypothetical protein
MGWAGSRMQGAPPPGPRSQADASDARAIGARSMLRVLEDTPRA